MNGIIAQGLKNLDEQALYAVVKDCEARIGSHVVGGDPLDAYVEKQRSIIEAVQKELQTRNQLGGK